MPERKKGIRVSIRQSEHGYLYFHIVSKVLRKRLAKKNKAELCDTVILFWGLSAEEALKNFTFTAKEELKLSHNEWVGKIASEGFLSERIIYNRDLRQRRAELIEHSEEAIEKITKQYIKESQDRLFAKEIEDPGTIPAMDGSSGFWLRMIMAARQDFLSFCGDEDRWSNEDYITARAFLFRDDYRIPLDMEADPCPDCNAKALTCSGKGDFEEMIDSTKEDKEDICPTCGGMRKAGGWLAVKTGKNDINLREIIDVCVEICEARGDSFPANILSVEILRRKLALLSGDPKLIALYAPDDK